MNAYGTEQRIDDTDDEPLAVRNLNNAQREQLGLLLEHYMETLETGVPSTVEWLTRNDPELLEPLRVCVSALESLHLLAAGGTPPSGPAHRDAGEQQLGGFELHEPIGRGGMGVVYRATQRSLNRTVAVKVLPLAAVLDPRQLTRFQHEAEAAASLQHPHIVPVYAVGCERGVHFYAMQYVHGESLDQWIAARNSSDWRSAVRMAADIADGLHAAHELGIVHRDIKPSNLLLDRSGKAWITDFGLARIQTETAVTRSGDVLGTLRYMSPEQARGESALVDGRSDVYSLAATLYEMLTSQPAHLGDDAPAILRTLDENAIVPLRRLRADLPQDLETVIHKAMAGRRDDRYETAAAFASDLRRVLAGEPTMARPPSILDRIVRFANKHHRAAAASAIVGVLVVIGFAVGTAKLAAAKQLSDAHSAQSLENERIARDAIDRLGGQVAELLADIPSANAVRHRLLHETLEYYQRFADSPISDAASGQRRMLDLAVTYAKMGGLQAELADTTAAIQSLRKSEHLYQQLVDDTKASPTVQLDHSICQNNLAEQLAIAGDAESASKWFTQAIETQKRLHANGHVKATSELAKTLNNLGGLLASTENIDEAKLAYSRAIDLIDQHPQQADLRSSIESNLAGLLAKREPALSVELARRSLRHQLDRLAANPSDPQRATGVVATLNSLANAYSASGQHAIAADTQQQAVDIGRQLNARWPEQASYRRDLVISLNHWGMSLSALGRLPQADAALEEATQLGRQLQDTFANSAEVQSMLGAILNNLGILKRQSGDARAARLCYEEAAEHQRMAVRLAPDVSRYAEWLNKHRHNLKQLESES